jgi:hypothetical protein
MVTFKKYLLLNEWTRELMPEIYAALEKYDDPMVGVHFSKGVPYKDDDKERVPHISLNLRPFHNDPIGIYAFPKDYVLSGNLRKNDSFRKSSNYYIIKPSSKARILNLSKMNYDEARKILIDMGIDTTNSESWLDSGEIYHHSGSSVGHKFWGVLEKVRKQLSIKHKNYSWNILFKDSGYNVLYDDGSAIIHPNEPSQIVYLDSSAMEVLDQGTQKNENMNVYSFFVKSFPNLRPKKQKEYNDFYLKLIADKYIIYVHSESDNKIKIQVLPRKSEDYGEQIEKSISFADLNDNFIDELKDEISEFEKKLSPMEEKIPSELQKISERFNIKLKKDNRGDYEIRQKYQDENKEYIVTFYIRQGKRNNMFFVLKKEHKNESKYRSSWMISGLSYHHAVEFEYSENSSPAQIVTTGLDLLKIKASNDYKAKQTIELLRKRVFRL